MKQNQTADGMIGNLISCTYTMEMSKKSQQREKEGRLDILLAQGWKGDGKHKQHLENVAFYIRLTCNS